VKMNTDLPQEIRDQVRTRGEPVGPNAEGIDPEMF